ncbi:hypothetical protein GCM10027059_16330 [Myceligenerans halotolerans]
MSGSRPIAANSVVPMVKPPAARAMSAGAFRGSMVAKGLQTVESIRGVTVGDTGDERGDREQTTLVPRA